jgi:hypothetical protein
VAAFFPPQTPAGRPAEEEVLQAGYLLAAESTQAEPGQRRLRSGAGVEVPPPPLRVAETGQPPSGGSPELLRVPSKKTNAVVAGKLAVSVALAFLSPFLPYANYDGGPGTPLSASLLISKEIL